MTIENFVLDIKNQSVSWIYEGKTIKETFVNAYFASVDKQNNYVYVESGNNYSQEQIYHLSFDGKHIFEVDKLKNTISWLYQNKSIKINCKNIADAQIYKEQIVIIISETSNNVGKKLQGYALDGTLLFEKKPPKGYSFVNLSSFRNQPSVVCDGGKIDIDVYGRNKRQFSINIKTGEMIKENLAY